MLLGIPDDQRRRAARALEACPRLTLGAGQTPEPGTISPSSLVIVENGSCIIVCPGEGGRRPVVVAVATRDAVLPAPSGDETIVAVTPVALTLVPQETCRTLLGEPDVAAAIARGLADSNRAARESLAVFGHVSHSTRVREKLLQLAREHGKVAADGVVVELPLTQEVFAGMVGSARETVSTALSELSRAGFLVRNGRYFKLAVAPDDL